MNLPSYPRTNPLTLLPTTPYRYYYCYHYLQPTLSIYDITQSSFLPSLKPLSNSSQTPLTPAPLDIITTPLTPPPHFSLSLGIITGMKKSFGRTTKFVVEFENGREKTLSLKRSDKKGR